MEEMIEFQAITFFKTDEKKKTEYIWSLTTPVRYILIKEHPFCMAAVSSTLVIQWQ